MSLVFPAGGVKQNPSLQYVLLPIVNRTKCATSYAQFSANSRTPIIVTESQICAQGMENMDACQGTHLSTVDNFCTISIIWKYIWFQATVAAHWWLKGLQQMPDSLCWALYPSGHERAEYRISQEYIQEFLHMWIG